ncbi:MAG: sigma-70 family RNA polymerase sigma factor [Planctomycetes bacterium]|nr:sigma-70 family RNA polymerase sigma factor [Planctomycetota bacterium]MCC7172322.1 sigma-70 family RNA polymerase sigma factor [Planctomycetota bacterium]
MITSTMDPRSLLKSIRARGFATHDDLDALLSDATTPKRFEKATKPMLTQLAGVEIRAWGTYTVAKAVPGKKAPDGYGFEFLLKGHAKSDPLHAYISEIVCIPRMEREDELRLARRLEFVRQRFQRAILAAGVPMRTARLILKSSRIRSLVEHSEGREGLARHLPEGNRSIPVRRACREYNAVREEFIERNLHLVVAAATAYRTYGVPVLDLIQEGNAGLIRAVEKFDWRKNVRFRTYATFWIRQAIERAIAFNKGIVRVPNYLQQKMRKLRREGTIAKKNEFVSVSDVSRATDLNHTVAGRLLEIERTTRSLDAPMGAEGDGYFGATLESEREETTIHAFEMPLLRSRVSEVLSALSEPERSILEHRYGLNKKAPMTLEEVGRMMKVSRERVRQLQVRALRKLQAPSLISKLAGFV